MLMFQFNAEQRTNLAAAASRLHLQARTLAKAQANQSNVPLGVCRVYIRKVDFESLRSSGNLNPVSEQIPALGISSRTHGTKNPPSKGELRT